MIGWPFDSTVTLNSDGLPTYSNAYSSDNIASIFRAYLSNGVYMQDNPTSFQVTPYSGMQLSVSPGIALVSGRFALLEDTYNVTLAAANAAYDRIDTVVLRLDLTPGANRLLITIRGGAAGASPVAPTLTRNATYFELGLADIYVVANATTISAARITDTRLNSSKCGVIASVIGDVDTSTLYAQIQADLSAFKVHEQAEFLAWFATAQDTLGEDSAGNLYNLITANTTAINQINANANLKTYTTTDQIGVSVGDTTTLEQLAAALPDGAVLMISPPATATSNISPSANRYGMLSMRRVSSSRVYCTFESRDSSGFSELFRCSVNYDGTTWTAYAWMRTVTDAGTQAWSGTWSTGSITVPGSADGKLAILNIAGLYGLQLHIRVQTTMYASATYYTGTEIRNLFLKITTNGTTWTCEYFDRQTQGQSAVNGALVTGAFSIGSIYLV